MSALPLDKVHGDHLVQRTLPDDVVFADYRAPLDPIIAGFNQPIVNVNWSSFLGRPVYDFTLETGLLRVDAISGEMLPAPDEETIRTLAALHYLGEGSIQQVAYLPAAPAEASGASGPIWRVDFDDLGNTTLYFDPATGKMGKVRSDLWRLFDFVWMLHIMDYDTRDNINNPLLVSFAAAALLFTLSGLILLWRSFIGKKRQRINRATV